MEERESALLIELIEQVRALTKAIERLTVQLERNRQLS